MSQAAESRPGWPLPQLPPGFVLGVATSATEVEGATDADGRGPSIWDTFAAQPGRIDDGSTPAQAADHYRRAREDVDLLADLGVRGYRFSVSWPRVQPDGRTLDPRGLDHYDRLVDRLLAAGISPMVTLYHWDLPQALEDDGGWLNRETIERFADYAAIVAGRLADRVPQWVPVNEPAVAAFAGNAFGQHAPGRELGLDALHVAHHLVLGHGRAVAALRATGVQQVGCANQHAPVWPLSEDDADVGASKIFDALWNGMFTEPMLLGRYPADLTPLLDDLLLDGDVATMRQPLDFYGVSHHAPFRIGASDPGSLMPFEMFETVGYPTTDAGWPVVPTALREWLITFRARYRAALPPLVVTGLGASFADPVGTDGEIDDVRRIEHLAGHLEAVSQAVHRGVDVRGLYVWSLLDGFSWSRGRSDQRGLVHVDATTGRRTPKASFHWLAEVVAAQTRSLG
ncbi:glycoside hydrolase family 1 protein [Nocardioides acrostichi]|uniref:Family 1 glycosylhydrolase n=1 Tax=Nocardioides acrostichi TaxID=2784339 RepID=A0A930YA64_9ACTN|nr:family 1 glycosylhydrolase [Nocardioides acrostichi]MBF4161093.1 family 1 glycosylhydrolase [Nocardioides acrostichi]